MPIFSEINNLFSRTFSMVKYSMVLTLPFLVFWLLLGFVLLPLTTGGGAGIFFTLFLVSGLTAAFLSGWMNMFKRSAETPVDENLPGEKRTSDSFELFREFFPGVGKYFGKMILGLVMYFFLFNIVMLIVEMVIIPMFGTFESFTQQELFEAMKDPDKTVSLWNAISAADKMKIYKIAGMEALFMFLFLYLTMFWPQLIVLKDIYPLKAFQESFKTVINDPVKTGIIFFINFALIFIVFFIGAILITNPLAKLVMILLFVYALVFYVMMTFLYLERYIDLSTVADPNP